MNILNIIKELRQTNSRLEKIAILEREKRNNNVFLKQVFAVAYNPFINFYIKKIPEYIFEENLGLGWALGPKGIQLLASREVTGHDAVAHLKDILERLTEDDAKVIELIIARDLDCGINESTINKVWPHLIPTFGVMLAHKDISGIKFPAIAQTKMDGARCHLVWAYGSAKAWSRQGKQFHLGDVFDHSMMAMFGAEDKILDGELLFTDAAGNFLDRKTSNGLANKANKNTLLSKDADNAVFVAWDIVDDKGKIPYIERFKTLRDTWKEAYKGMKKVNIQIVKSVEVNDENEAQEFFKQQLAEGQEGAVLKNLGGKWVPNRTKDLGKMKAEEEADLRIVSVQEGTGKFAGMLGAIEGATEDGLLDTFVGTGFSDYQRKNLWAIRDKLLGKIIAVKYNQIIENKDGGTKSLFLPVVIEIRWDKTVANTLDELK